MAKQQDTLPSLDFELDPSSPAFKPCESIGVFGERLRRDLQRHVPIQLGVSRPIHFAHTPLANEGGDVMVAESGADGQGHELMVMSESVVRYFDS